MKIVIIIWPELHQIINKYNINDTFNEFLKTCVKHFEICELENGQTPDMLFDQNMDSSENLANPSIFVNPHYTMDMYVNKNCR